MIILGVHPGGTTGSALVLDLEKVVDAGETRDPEEVIRYLREADEVVVESFRVRPSKGKAIRGARVVASEIIGMIGEAAAREGLLPPVLQDPSVKRLLPDPALRALDLWVPGRGHARDALRDSVADLRIALALGDEEAVSEILPKAAEAVAVLEQALRRIKDGLRQVVDRHDSYWVDSEEADPERDGAVVAALSLLYSEEDAERAFVAAEARSARTKELNSLLDELKKRYPVEPGRDYLAELDELWNRLKNEDPDDLDGEDEDWDDEDDEWWLDDEDDEDEEEA